jgi:hypothetical protein
VQTREGALEELVLHLRNSLLYWDREVDDCRREFDATELRLNGLIKERDRVAERLRRAIDESERPTL